MIRAIMNKLLRKSKQTYHCFVDYILFDFFPMDPIVLAKLRYELWCICSVYNSSSRKIIQKVFLAKYNVLLSNLLIIRYVQYNMGCLKCKLLSKVSIYKSKNIQRNYIKIYFFNACPDHIRFFLYCLEEKL